MLMLYFIFGAVVVWLVLRSGGIIRGLLTLLLGGAASLFTIGAIAAPSVGIWIFTVVMWLATWCMSRWGADD